MDKIYLTKYIYKHMCIEKVANFGVAMATLGHNIDPSLQGDKTCGSSCSSNDKLV
jgi:hypothetical protein